MDTVRAILQSAKLRGRAERMREIVDNVKLHAGTRKAAERQMNSALDQAAKIEKEHLQCPTKPLP